MGDLYACGSKVKIPFLGTPPVTKQVNNKRNAPIKATRRPTVHSPRVISELSSHLKFESSVVSSHCPEALTYNEARNDIKLLCRPPTSIISTNKRCTDGGRCDKRGEDHRHMPCYLHAPNYTNNSTGTSISKKKKSSKGTIGPPRDSCTVIQSQSSVSKWEESILKGMSLTTASHIVRKSSTGKRKVQQIITDREREKGNEEHYNELVLKDESNLLLPSVTTRGFISELTTGAIPVYVQGSPDTILLSNKTTFKKVLQPLYPPVPAQILGSNDKCYPFGGKVTKGHRRWTELPVRTCTPPESQWLLPTNERTVIDSSSSPKIEEMKYNKLPVKSKTEELMSVVKELLVKWQVYVQSSDVTSDRALQCLTAVSTNTKLYGLAIVISLMNKTKPFNITTIQEEDTSSLSAGIISKVSSLLKDEAERIRVTSCIILLCCSVNTMKEEIISVLQCSSHSSSTAEQWAAIQSLAIEGLCTPVVVKGLLSSIDETIPQYTVSLLSRISCNSTLVNAMLLEQLNSKSCKDRYVTCKLLPELDGGINKDVCNRLVTISWDDWSHSVRLAASQALGKAGQAKLIHDEIERRLKQDCESTRLDALRKLHTLHLMTSRLLPAYVECFKDDHMSVKLKAIALAQALYITDDSVINSLKLLMEDNSWKVKAHAIRGVLRAVRPEIVSHILWAVRFERLPEVRAESCHALALMGIKNDKVATALRDILIVEDNPLVLHQAKQALVHLGYTPTAEDSMAVSVCAEVKRLGSQGAITEQIQSLENKQMIQYIMSRPNDSVSSRDYFNKQRGQYGGSTWSPDKKTINKQLNEIGHLNQLDSNNILLNTPLITLN